MRTFNSPAELTAAAGGTDLGYSEWRTITQERIDAFADATDDHQWIHVDRERAARGQFKTTIAHGFLTLALIPAMVREIYAVHGAAMGINYGLERVRFPAPVTSGSEVRAHVLLKTTAADGGRVRVVTEVTVETRGGSKPACVAEMVSLVVF
jgi:acyl dehydratase